MIFSVYKSVIVSSVLRNLRAVFLRIPSFLSRDSSILGIFENVTTFQMQIIWMSNKIEYE